MEPSARDVHGLLLSAGATIAVAESLTGGLLGAELTSIAGSSATFVGGITAYASAAKTSLLGVSADLLAQHGEVKAEDEGGPLRLVLSNGSLYRADDEADARLKFETATLSLGVDEAVWQKNRFRAVRDELTPLELLRAASSEDQAIARPMAVAAHWKLGQVLMPLSFALLGVPLGLRRRTSGRARGAIATLGGYALFYVLAQVSTSLGDKGRLAPVLAGQLPNLVFVALGLLALWFFDRRGLAR